MSLRIARGISKKILPACIFPVNRSGWKSLGARIAQNVHEALQMRNGTRDSSWRAVGMPPRVVVFLESKRFYPRFGKA
jgi:hypothetical protein